MIQWEQKIVMAVKTHIATVILITMYLIQIAVNVKEIIKRYLIYVKVRTSISFLTCRYVINITDIP